ncbi:uncharacterized protein TNCV_3019071 [Trichonephila clavipes]|nr:uncharacterized protein TNCV_3019071 [Trichonephila clavipes]
MVDCGPYKNLRASATWKSPRKQKFCQDRSKGKVMLEMFFDIQGIGYLEFIPERRNANKELCVDILCSLCASIRKKTPKLQKYGITKAVTGNYQLYLVLSILMLYNHGYFLNRSPDLTPCDFYLWGFIKDCVYVPRLPADLSDLRHRMEADVARISSDTLKKVWDELAYQLNVCRVTNGAHVEHL